MGAVGLVAGPVMGAREGGVGGFFTGLGAGLLGAVALPVSGVVIGAVQLARGALNTPEAISERGKGKVWDEDTRTWVSYDLKEEAREMLALSEEEWCRQHGIPEGGGKKADEARGSGSVKETGLYDTLGVAPDATSGEIRKSYFRLAKELHPDRNRGDEASKAKFQAVGEAYQVLSSEEMRGKYDHAGRAALDQSSLVDASSFFAMCFGSEPFEYLIGELRLATLFSTGGDPNEAFLAYKQKRREVSCALALRGLLLMFEAGDEAEFEMEMHTHAKLLKDAPVGEALIWTCGYIYETKGLQALGGIEAVGAGTRDKAHTVGAQMRVAGAAIKTYKAYSHDLKAVEEREKKEREKGKGEQGKKRDADADDGGAPWTTFGEHHEAEAGAEADAAGADGGSAEGGAAGGGPSEGTMLLMLESMWRVSLLDIEATLRHACNKLLSDMSSSKEARRNRARGLVALGRIFQSYGRANAMKTMDFKQHVADVGEKFGEKLQRERDQADGYE